MHRPPFSLGRGFSANVWSLILLCALLAPLSLSPAGAQAFPSTAKAQPAASVWWDDYPLLTQSGILDEVTTYSSTVAFNGIYNDPSWGIYMQRAGDYHAALEQVHQAGLKSICYYETFGTITTFAVELGDRGVLDYTPFYRTNWAWSLSFWPDKGGPIRWVGPQNYFDDEDFARPWTRTHPRYGGPAMTYPDGTVATGYMSKFPPAVGCTDSSSDPRNSRVLDASCSKDIWGEYQQGPNPNDAASAINPDTGQPVGPLRGLIPTADGRYSSSLGTGKDACCPFWADFERASILFGADGGLDGIWTDNFSPWDSFGLPPISASFGDWSVARFRTYLKANFTSAQLTAMGVTAPDSFDVRAALRAKLKGWGGDNTKANDARWNDARWLDDPLWLAFKIYKRQSGTEGLDNFYNATKEAAAQAGKPDFFVAGNDIPFFGLGWVRGNLDAVSTEMTPSWHMGSSSRGIMLPPAGRFAPVYKLAREHAKSRLVNVWMYLNGPYAPYQGRSGIAQVLDGEMLANHTLPLVYPSNPEVMGNPASNAAFFKFVRQSKRAFGLRMPVADVGIYYSSSSVLAFMNPGGFYDMDHQPHEQGFLGWGTALDTLHYQYRALPEWKLTSDTLATLRVLIIPNAQVLDKSDVTSTIDPWVRAGGRLIVTGNSGLRQGEAGNYVKDPAGLALGGLTGVSSMTGAPARQLTTVGTGKVLFLQDNIGMNYFNAGDQTTAPSQRAALIGQFSQAMTDVLAGQGPLVLTSDAPSSVGLNVYEDARARRLFIDANNLDIDLASDTIHPSPTVHFQVQLPDWIKDLGADQIRLYVLSPDKPAPAVSLSLLPDGRANVTLGAFSHYASVVLEYPTQAPHWQKYE